MNMTRPLWQALLLAAALVVAGPALADRHGGGHWGGAHIGGGAHWHGGGHRHFHGGGGVFITAPFWPWWYDPFYDSGPIVVAPPDAGVPAAPANYWYYCPAANAYYPYVKTCPGGWQAVAPPAPAQ